ncbi:hypothetical protein BT93_I0245 [Corymbia citriodora subsp. variegata]|nr:hypothetical protein BT93_I0245 [Corymbia citriodora subsp. variegata]
MFQRKKKPAPFFSKYSPSLSRAQAPHHHRSAPELQSVASGTLPPPPLWPSGVTSTLSLPKAPTDGIPSSDPTPPSSHRHDTSAVAFRNHSLSLAPRSPHRLHPELISTFSTSPPSPPSFLAFCLALRVWRRSAKENVQNTQMSSVGVYQLGGTLAEA